MRPRFSILSLVLALLAVLSLAPASALARAPGPATDVGFRVVMAPDPKGPPITVGIWYPTMTPATAPERGMDDLPVASNAPIVGDRLPLVVMSHGNGGWFGGHYDTAIALAKAGFVVAALTHTGDNYQDQSRATDMANRPRQLHVLIDYMLKDWDDHGRLDPDRVGAFGFSSGGFTVLTAAGGELDGTRIQPHCRDYPTHYDCQLMLRVSPPPGGLANWVHDDRIKAVVSAAPALGYAFKAETLKGLRQPIQLWRAEDDEILPDPFHATAVRASLPNADYHVVAKARHFDFLTPCNDYTRKTLAFLCNSDPSFDRAAFHRDFDASVTAFFKANLAAKP
ncbi:dienelactone hydrolase [Caulobacter sp. Root1455]|nr:dienelactone hydrolase [Caulobacter sp. Root1455]